MAGVLIHEWLSERGGSENVVVELSRIFPDAPIIALWDDAPQRFTAGRVRETWLSKTPLRHHKSLALPFMPAIWRHLGSSDADWMLCSSHLFAHHAQLSGPNDHVRKYVYAHTPARYIWTPELDARGDGFVARAVSRPLQVLDRRRAQEAHSVAANSAYVARRIEDTWHRESTVIYPPVQVGMFAEETGLYLTAEEEDSLASLPEVFLLGASRFVPYKRLDVAIDAGIATGIPVVIAGDGPDGPRLRQLADQRPGLVTFIEKPSQSMLRALYRRATVYVFAAIEDFGIMPVEAMAAGTPVIANAVGGAAESVQHGVTGALLESFDPVSLREAVELAIRASPADCQARAWDFDVSVFDDNIRSWIAT
jgi:glycosyltransferase involved in cell wall biosynthesis